MDRSLDRSSSWSYILPDADILKKHAILYHGYVKDTQLSLRFNSRDPPSLLEAITKMEACLADQSKWMAVSKLKLKHDKTEFIISVMSHLQSLVDQLRLSLRVQDCIIQPSKCVRNLGAYLDREMTMLLYVNQIVRGVYGTIKLLSRISMTVQLPAGRPTSLCSSETMCCAALGSPSDQQDISEVSHYTCAETSALTSTWSPYAE